ncbi:hypothetical protein [Sphingomonas agri]|uniref:hypothetical protein n=1 Tax=Sphingomonas agri TaxID=1813878 RepID=UPI00311DA15D
MLGSQFPAHRGGSSNNRGVHATNNGGASHLFDCNRLQPKVVASRIFGVTFSGGLYSLEITRCIAEAVSYFSAINTDVPIMSLFSSAEALA